LNTSSKSKFWSTILGFGVLLSAGSLLAQEPTAAEVQNHANYLWTLIAAFMVFFMQAGFAMVEAGFTRAKNVVNILLKNLMDMSAGAL